MTEAQELVTKLLSEGAKEFPHQWGASYIVRSVYSDDADARRCLLCEEETFAPSGNGHGECPVLLRAALDLTRQQLADALDPTVREE